jgi:short-subunit dehydrogenase involved in D-alanine esterification of teichoic acids
LERLVAQKFLITAAASGIGREFARAFSSIGATVFITDINVQALDAAQKEMPGLLIKMCDNSKRSDIEAMVPAAVEALGGLDVLINNAGSRVLLHRSSRSTRTSGKR